MSLENNIKKEIISQKLFPAKEKIVIGVSGGIDSVALLDILTKILEPSNIIVAHVDHSLREESGNDLLFVKGLAKRYKTKFYSRKILKPKNKKKNIEEWAREERYNFFLKVAKKENSKIILTAHHADDQIETVFLNFGRGAGIKGLCGMNKKRQFSVKEKSIFIVRPFLDIFRSEIDDYQRKHKLDFREDKTNRDISFSRNWLRQKTLKNVSEKDKKETLHLIKDINQKYSLIQKEISQIMESIALRKTSLSLSLDRKRFNLFGEESKKEMLLLAIKEVLGNTDEISSTHLEKVIALAKVKRSGKELQFPRGLRVIVGYDSLIILKGKFPVPALKKRILRFGKNRVPELNVSVFVEKKKENSAFLFDYDKIAFPLYLRGAKEGGRFIPKGMSGTKKLQDFFTDEKIEKSIRKSLPIIVDNKGNILGILGLRQGGYALPDKDTSKYLSVYLKETEGVK